MLERLIEEASLNSWPAYQQVLFDGWVMRFANGYSKRANSVTPVYPSFLSAQDKIATCEQFYKEKCQPVIFRLPSFSSTTHELDSLLEQRQYRQADVSQVLSRKLIASETPAPTLQIVSLDAWLHIFCQCSRVPVERHQIHRELLERIGPGALFAVLQTEGIPVACGLGVLENTVFGLFDIVTDSEQRSKGYGTRLVTDMLAWAAQHGALDAYLQVVSTNLIARHLYEKLGFRELYRYWYRVRDHLAHDE